MRTGCKYFMLVFLLLLLHTFVIRAQVIFNRVPLFEENVRGFIVAMAQDQKGYMWFAGTSLYRYDGYHLVTYKNDPLNPNSISASRLESICIDRKGIIWIGTFSSGLDRYDPESGVFIHFSNNPKDPASLSNNIVTSIIEDREGTIWVGTHGGLNRLDQNTGKFTVFQKNINDENSLSNDQVRALYEDRQGTIWVGCGSPFGNETPTGEGGLNRMDKKTGKFIRYLYDPDNDQTLMDNKVRAIYEDSRGTFWVGTFGDGLHIMDRAKGTFKRFLSDPEHPQKLSTPLTKGRYYGVNFIQEDITGNIWIGSFFGGLNQFDPKASRVTHYESEKDNENSMTENSVWAATTSRDGVLWISTQTKCVQG